jgi:F-type H+-transporting ATPase subunit delta
VADRAERRELVRGYAQALFAVADAEGDLGVVEDELFAFAGAVESNPQLRDALTDAALPPDRKGAVVQDILGGTASPHTINILRFLIDQGRARDLGAIIEELATMAAERRQHVVAEVRCAVPLDEAQRASLAAALSRATGRAIELKLLVDPAVLGGVVARIGDEVFDGTVRTRLMEARDLLRSR